MIDKTKRGDKLKSKIVPFLFVLLFGTMPVHAQNSVVVVPLAGDDAAPGLAGFSSSTTPVESLAGDTAVIRSVTMTLPNQGTAIVNVSGNGRSPGALASEEFGCFISLNTDDFDFGSDLLIQEPSDAAGTSFSGTRGFNVDSGENTFNLVCAILVGEGVQVTNGSLTVMYFPDP